MEIRCQNCAWLLSLSADAVARAVAVAQAQGASRHTFHCPQCGGAIELAVTEMRQFLPDDYPLPQVSPAPAAAAPTAAPAPSRAATQPTKVVAAKALATNVAEVPLWDPKQKDQVTQLAFRLSIVGVLSVFLITLYWLLTENIPEAEARALPTGVDLAVTLAPVLAAAAAVERFLETIFGVIEHNWRTLVAYLGHGVRWLHGAETEVENAHKWLAEVSFTAHQIMEENTLTPEQIEALLPNAIDQGKTVEEWRNLAQQRLDLAKSLMDMAQKRLLDAERDLAALPDSANYKNAKRAASIVLGLWLGLIIATIGQLQMFAMLSVGVVPAKIDVLVTGLVIGSGSYPVHSLVGLLQQAKDTLDGAQSYLKGKSAQTRQMIGG